MTQKEKVLEFIKEQEQANTNDLRYFGIQEYISDPEKRARELFADGLVDRRWITEEEKQARGYKKDVMVYFVK